MFAVINEQKKSRLLSAPFTDSRSNSSHFKTDQSRRCSYRPGPFTPPINDDLPSRRRILKRRRHAGLDRVAYGISIHQWRDCWSGTVEGSYGSGQLDGQQASGGWADSGSGRVHKIGAQLAGKPQFPI